MEAVPSASGLSLIGLEDMPLAIALALPLEVVLSVTRLCGAIADLEEVV